VEEEIDRILPVIETVNKEFEILVSIDTYKDRVAKAAVLEGGADMVNDISALRFAENMADTIAQLRVPVILMHMKGTPENMQRDPFYRNVIVEMKQFFRQRINFALSKGINKEKIIIDPGIGFGKRFEDNIKILKRLDEFKDYDCPLLVGLSRKSFLMKISGEPVPEEREAESIAANMVSIMNGASIIRVHNVANAVKAVKVFKTLVDY
jgi:dihydropteroate synthase